MNDGVISFEKIDMFRKLAKLILLFIKIVQKASVGFIVPFGVSEVTYRIQLKGHMADSDGVINSGADIYSYSQIIQGILILLSSAVAVAGYIVQSRLREKELKRQLKLDRVRQQLSEFVGPCSILSNCFWLAYWRLFADRNKFKMFAGSTTDKRCFLPSSLSLDVLAEGRIQNYYNDVGFSVKALVDGSFNALESWVGPDVEDEMRRNPDSELAVAYRTNVKFLFTKYIKPQALLFTKYGGHLVLLGDAEKFKKMYPSAAGSGWLRNLFILQFINWSDEFEEVVFPMWEKNDYRLLFPTISPYPIQLGMYLTRMVTALRALEAELGTADHKVHSTDKDMKRGREKEGAKATKEKETKKKETVKEKVKVKEIDEVDKDGSSQVRQRYVVGSSSEKEVANEV